MPTETSRNGSLIERIAWVTGAGGLIGSHIAHHAALPAGYRVIALTRADLDLTDSKAVARRFHAESPALVIHCAAISTAAACDRDPRAARALNTDATAHLAELSASIRFVYLSTDLVFDGRKGHYTETDPVNPLNLYAETKASAEQRIAGNPRHLTIRTSLNAGKSPTGDRSFLEHMRRDWKAGKILNLFTDEFRNPIPATATARAVWELASSPADGIVHAAGAERLSRLQIGELLAARWLDIKCGITPASVRDFQGPPRAADCTLDCSKAQALLRFTLPRFSEWLAARPDAAP